MVLELAVAAGCISIVAFNLKDFQGSEGLGVRVLLPAEFLEMLNENQTEVR
jgi:hypothetical protein